MKTDKKINQFAKKLVELSKDQGALNEQRVAEVLSAIKDSKHRQPVRLLKAYLSQFVVNWPWKRPGFPRQHHWGRKPLPPLKADFLHNTIARFGLLRKKNPLLSPDCAYAWATTSMMLHLSDASSSQPAASDNPNYFHHLQPDYFP